MLANMRLKYVEVAVDQFGRTEGHFIGEMNAATVRFDRVSFERNLTRNVAFRILVVLSFDINAGTNLLERVNGISRVIYTNPNHIFERRQHFGTHLGTKHRTAWSFIDKTVSSYCYD